jgi:hypothetical protein
MDGYTEDDCSVYTGTCYTTCKLCPRGHTIYDCSECVDHAYMNEFNECVCNKDWAGEGDCSVYSGVCAPHCRVCSGPDTDDCLDCIATLTPQTTVDGADITLAIASVTQVDELPYFPTVIAPVYSRTDQMMIVTT